MKTNLPDSALADEYTKNPVKACRKALRLTAEIHWQRRLEEINRLLGLHGVEAIRGDWQNGYWCDIVATYCNTGDTYGVTVLCVRGDSWRGPSFRVSTMGDFVERNGRKLGII